MGNQFRQASELLQAKRNSKQSEIPSKVKFQAKRNSKQSEYTRFSIFEKQEIRVETSNVLAW